MLCLRSKPAPRKVIKLLAKSPLLRKDSWYGLGVSSFLLLLFCFILYIISFVFVFDLDETYIQQPESFALRGEGSQRLASLAEKIEKSPRRTDIIESDVVSKLEDDKNNLLLLASKSSGSKEKSPLATFGPHAEIGPQAKREDLSNKLYLLYNTNNNNNNDKILSEVYKLEDERQKEDYLFSLQKIEAETNKIVKQCEDLQEKIDNLDRAKISEEFNRLPSDIKSLAKENIYDEQNHLKQEKIENLNKLCNLHMEKINIYLNHISCLRSKAANH